MAPGSDLKRRLLIFVKVERNKQANDWTSFSAYAGPSNAPKAHFLYVFFWNQLIINNFYNLVCCYDIKLTIFNMKNIINSLNLSMIIFPFQLIFGQYWNLIWLKTHLLCCSNAENSNNGLILSNVTIYRKSFCLRNSKKMKYLFK